MDKQGYLNGQYALSEISVKENAMNYDVFQLFRLLLDGFLIGENEQAEQYGYYVYKLEHSIYYFKWYHYMYEQSPRYLQLLKDDGWIC